LRVQRCLSCGHLRYPLAPWCPVCLAPETEWQALSGRGTILSRLIFHQSYHPAWKGRLPYNVVLVQLEEGPRMFSNVLPLSKQDIEIGMPVEVAFDREGEFAIPRFVTQETTGNDQ
jgi:uncharacterized OB-fold protein